MVNMYFSFFQAPLGSIDMREASVAEVDQSAVSDDEGDEKTEPTKFTLSIVSRKPDKQSTTFLNYSSQEEKVCISIHYETSMTLYLNILY